MRELLQKLSHPLFNQRPILDPAMHLEHILAHPAPELLNRIEPGGVGRQPDRFEAWIGPQGFQHLWMGVNVPVVLDHVEELDLGVDVVKLLVELDHLPTSHNVAVQIINLSGHRIQTADSTPLLIVARALGYRHLSAPGGGDLRPALIPKLVQKQCDHRLGVPGRVTQTALQPLDLAVVVGVWTKQAHARRLQGQTTQLQHAPHPTQRVGAQPVQRYAARTQRPAAGDRTTPAHGNFLPGRRAGPCMQAVKQFLSQGVSLLEGTSDDSRPVDGPGLPPGLRSHPSVAMQRRSRGPAASVAPGSRPRAESVPPRSSAGLRSARARRAASHGPDSAPPHGVAGPLTPAFVVLPSVEPPRLPDGNRYYRFCTSKFIRDEGYSGARIDRPALDRLRDAAARGEFQTVLGKRSRGGGRI